MRMKIVSVLRAVGSGILRFLDVRFPAGVGLGLRTR